MLLSFSLFFRLFLYSTVFLSFQISLPQVRDQDIPVKRNLVRVIVNVEDTNDNAPWFIGAPYTGRVFESAAIGSAVLQVTALDKDKGHNAEIIYSIESGKSLTNMGHRSVVFSLRTDIYTYNFHSNAIQISLCKMFESSVSVEFRPLDLDREWHILQRGGECWEDL